MRSPSPAALRGESSHKCLRRSYGQCASLVNPPSHSTQPSWLSPPANQRVPCRRLACAPPPERLAAAEAGPPRIYRRSLGTIGSARTVYAMVCFGCISWSPKFCTPKCIYSLMARPQPCAFSPLSPVSLLCLYTHAFTLQPLQTSSATSFVSGRSLVQHSFLEVEHRLSPSLC